MFQALFSFFVFIAKQYGIISSTVVFAILFGLMMKYKDKFKKILKIFKKDNIDFEKMFNDNHEQFNQRLIFYRLQYLINIRIKEINCYCTLRKQLYKRIFTIKINKFLQGLKQFVKQDIDNLDRQMFGMKLINFFQQKHLQWKEQCLKQEVPQFIMESIDYEIQDLRAMFHTNITRILQNTYLYSNNRQKLNIILELFLGLQQNILNVCQQVLSSFNGQVKKLQFKGVKCRQCATCVHDEYLKMQRMRLRAQRQKQKQKQL